MPGQQRVALPILSWSALGCGLCQHSHLPALLESEPAWRQEDGFLTGGPRCVHHGHAQDSGYTWGVVFTGMPAQPPLQMVALACVELQLGPS